MKLFEVSLKETNSTEIEDSSQIDDLALRSYDLSRLQVDEWTFPELLRLYLMQHNYTDSKFLDELKGSDFWSLEISKILMCLCFLCNQFMTTSTFSNYMADRVGRLIGIRREAGRSLGKNKEKDERIKGMMDTQIQAASTGTFSSEQDVMTINHRQNSSDFEDLKSEPGSQMTVELPAPTRVPSSTSELERHIGDLDRSGLSEASEESFWRDGQSIEKGNTQLKDPDDKFETHLKKEDGDGGEKQVDSVDLSTKLCEQKMLARLQPLGQDRDFCTYWVFPHIPGLYKLDVSDDYWGVFFEEQHIKELIESLNPLGRREYRLAESLKRLLPSLLDFLESFRKKTSSFFKFLSDQQLTIDIPSRGDVPFPARNEASAFKQFKLELKDKFTDICLGFGYMKNLPEASNLGPNKEWIEMMHRATNIRHLRLSLLKAYETLPETCFKTDFKMFLHEIWPNLLEKTNNLGQTKLVVYLLFDGIDWDQSAAKRVSFRSVENLYISWSLGSDSWIVLCSPAGNVMKFWEMVWLLSYALIVPMFSI